jgi:acyl-CoA oxidase
MRNVVRALRTVLEKAIKLFATSIIERDIGWYLINGVLDADAAARIVELSRQLCADIGAKDVALNIVQGFGVPEHLINAPIAQDWKKYNEIDNQGELITLGKQEREEK